MIFPIFMILFWSVLSLWHGHQLYRFSKGEHVALPGASGALLVIGLLIIAINLSIVVGA